MNVIRALLRSRKFVAALISVVVSILVAVGMDETVAGQLVTAVMVLATAYILGTAYEDGQEKSATIIEADDEK